jgi:hypothetical protein
MRNFNIKKAIDLDHVAQTDFMLLGIESFIDSEINDNWVAIIFDDCFIKNIWMHSSSCSKQGYNLRRMF